MEVTVDTYAWLPKDQLSFAQIHLLKKELTVIPRETMPNQKEEPKPIFLFQETSSHLGIAREYFFEKRRPAHRVTLNVTSGNPALFTPFGRFVGVLRPEQAFALETVQTQFLAGRLGGIIRAPTGWGKTVAACGLMAQTAMPTLVLLHKEFLLNQWRERIEKFLPEASIGHVQQDVCDYRGRSVVLGMIQSVGSGKYPQEFYDWPGLILVDETHRVGAYTWAPVPAMFRARHRVGFTATPRRKDGAENVFFYNIGSIIFSGKEQRLGFKVKRVWTKFRLVKTDKFNPNLAPRSLLITFLCGSEFRNRIIIEQLINAVHAGRKVLVLSERLNHLDKMKAFLAEMWPQQYGPSPSTGFYVGGRSEDQLTEARKATVIFATYQFASEGLDIPEIDTLFMTTPMSDVEQAVGRILRPHEDKKEPIVVDFRDDAVVVLEKMGKKRDEFYSQAG